MTLSQEQLNEARLTLRKQFEQKRAEQKQRFQIEAEQAYELEQRRAKERWIADWKRDNYEPLQYPYTDWSDEDIYRVSLPHETRIEKLLEARMYSTALRCWLYRRGSKAPLSSVKDFLRPYLGEVDGDEEFFVEHVTEGAELTTVGRAQTTYRTHHVVTCSGLSPELKAVLHSLTVVRNVVYFAVRSEIIDRPGRPGERLTLAHQMPDEYPQNEY